MQDVLVQKKQKLPIMYIAIIEEMKLTQFQWDELDELCRSTIRLHLAESVYFSQCWNVLLLMNYGRHCATHMKRIH